MCLLVGIDFQMKTITLGSTIITLQLWDTAGQERSDHLYQLFLNTIYFTVMGIVFPSSSHHCPFRFRSITEQYYRKADGILAIYDISQPPSFSAVRGWMDSVEVRADGCHG